MYLSKKPQNVVNARSRAAYDLFFDEYASIIYGLINLTTYGAKQKEEIFAKAVQALWNDHCQNLTNEKVDTLAIIKAIAKIAVSLRNMNDMTTSTLSNAKDKLQWAKEFINDLVTKSTELDNQNKTA